MVSFVNGYLLRYPVLKFAMFLFFLMPMTAFGAPAQNSRLILIDAAHGGEDFGVHSDKLREKDLTLNLALMIRQEAQKVRGLKVQLTRSADKNMTMTERIGTGSTAKANCIISLHVNAGFGNQSTGYEIYFPGFQQEVAGGKDSSAIIKDMARNKSLNDSVRLAQVVQSFLEKVLPRKGRGLRDAPSPVLDGLTIPGLVIEIGFLTHPDDRKRLAGPDMQKAIAIAVVKGLESYNSSMPE